MSTSGDFDEVGLRLAEARRRAGMTQERLGQAMGLDKTQVSKIESGRRRLDISEVALAANALSVSTRSLLGMEERTKLALAARLAVDAPNDAWRDAYRRARQLIEIDDTLSEVGGLRSALPSVAAEALLEHARTLGRQAVRSKAAAQRHGQAMAEETRATLELGVDSLGSVPDLIETQFGVDVRALATWDPRRRAVRARAGNQIDPSQF